MAGFSCEERVQSNAVSIAYLSREVMMAPEFTKTLFLQSLDEWGEYAPKFKALPAEEQSAFLNDQGYDSLHDILAHVAVWWEEAGAIIRDTIENRDRPSRKYDFDEFNAASLARFTSISEADLLTWYESQRKALIVLISSLTDEQMKIRRVYGWLNGVTLEHIKEHGFTAPRFLVLDTLQREWEGYIERFQALPEEKQKAFFEKNGFTRFRDALAHIIAWREDGLEVINAISKDPAYHQPEMDNDTYNAQAVETFGKLEEAEVWKRFESTRQELIELVMNLPEETFQHKDVQAWLRDDVIDHYFEHAV
ncbi:MAG TPA: ClbS/DfsB family four-helix bundle protein [Anaerolineales bacterium]|nr:ClbS/DfsB family four-helix bundle protein [Anaerolineales bacterium]